MHLMRMNLGGVPPFTEPVKLKFDERVNLFIGPNASGKSTILLVLADCLIGPEEEAKRPISQGRAILRAGLYTDDEFDEFITEYSNHSLSTNFFRPVKIGLARGPNQNISRRSLPRFTLVPFAKACQASLTKMNLMPSVILPTRR